MGKIIDLTGQKFNMLTVLEATTERRNRQVVWKCRCDCGKITYLVGSSLRNGHTKSCGCLNTQSKNCIDMTNQKIKKITVVERAGTTKHRKALWLCLCDCGEEFIAEGTEIRQGLIESCPICKKNIIEQNKKEDYNFQYKQSKYYQNIINKKFGMLTPIEPTEDRNNAGRVIWKCKCDCGNPNYVYVPASALRSGNTQSCGCLFGKSKNEEKIKEILIKNNINFKTQVSFKDLLSPKERVLKFDFAIYDDEKQLKRLIEYDGIQHFKSIEYFGGKSKFDYQKICDKIKNDYCKKNNIQLIRIPYTHNNITLEDLIGDEFIYDDTI